MSSRNALPGCSLLLWGLFLGVGLTFRPSSPEQGFYYWGLPAAMALASLLLIFVNRAKQWDVAVQACALVVLLTFAWFFLGYSGGI